MTMGNGESERPWLARSTGRRRRPSARLASLAIVVTACAATAREAPQQYPEPSTSYFESITASLTLGGEPVPQAGAKVERPFFESTGVRPFLGRLFVVGEYRGNETPAVVLSHPLWQDELDGRPEVIGSGIDIDGVEHTVVGIMPPGFDSPRGARFWVAGPPPPLVVRGVRLFDGTAVIPDATVVVENRRITRVAASGEPVETPPGAEIVDGAGKTLLPGLIDAHTHTGGRNDLKAATAYGVTTELDMFTGLDVVRAMKREQQVGMAADRADLFSSGTLVTAPGGHGTQYGVAIPTLASAAGADEFVEARIDEGADYVKIVYEDGSAFGLSVPTFDEATVKAAIDAAHARGKVAVVHIGTQELARAAIAAGADGLMHAFGERPPDADFGAFVARHGAFVVPTLAVLESTSGGTGGAALVDDPRLNPLMRPHVATALQRTFPLLEGTVFSLDNALAVVSALHTAGVPLLAGSDAPNPGTYFGVTIHRELELLVRAGLSPIEALAAATSAAADAFGLDDRGRIAVGNRADLVLVDGDPTTDILQTRAIDNVWKEGRRWKLELLRLQVATERSGR